MPLIMSRFNEKNPRISDSDSRKLETLSNAELSARMGEVQAKVAAHLVEVEHQRSGWIDTLARSRSNQAASKDPTAEKLSLAHRGSKPRLRPVIDIQFRLDA
jgi:hypothetical protein